MDKRNNLVPPKKVRMIEVIEVISLIGNGSDDPVRHLHQYWSKDGELLAERDSLKGVTEYHG
jgi:hypothetical protein